MFRILMCICTHNFFLQKNRVPACIVGLLAQKCVLCMCFVTGGQQRCATECGDGICTHNSIYRFCFFLCLKPACLPALLLLLLFFDTVLLLTVLLLTVVLLQLVQHLAALSPNPCPNLCLCVQSSCECRSQFYSR